MFLAVKGVYNKNRELIAGYAPLKVAFDDFLARVDAIQQESTDTETDTAGSFDQKLQIKEAMAREVSALASGAEAYAHQQGDRQLIAQFDVSFSDLRYTADQLALDEALSVMNAIQGHMTELEAFLITEADIASAREKVEAFQDHLEKAGALSSRSATSTGNMKMLFKEARDLLYLRIDLLMDRLQLKEPALYNVYTHSRGIKDLGATRTEGLESSVA